MNSPDPTLAALIDWLRATPLPETPLLLFPAEGRKTEFRLEMPDRFRAGLLDDWERGGVTGDVAVGAVVVLQRLKALLS